MATRATAQEILDILIGVTATTAQVDPFLTASNITVTAELGTNTDLSAAQKKEIERWLAAHLFMTARGQEKEKQLGAAKTVLNRTTGLGLDSTTFGQQVKVLDTTGILSNLGKVAATFTVPDITA